MVREMKTKILSVLAVIFVFATCFGLQNLSFATKADARVLTTIVSESGASVLNFGGAATISAGETVTMEAEVKSARFGGTGAENFGFVVSDKAGNTNAYAVGDKASFVFGRQTQRLAIIWVKSENTTYTNVDTDSPIAIGGLKRMDFGFLFSAGNFIKVEYKSASSGTAKDGSWKIFYMTENDDDYTLYCSFSGLGVQDAPYGGVYFGINGQIPFQLELYDLSVKTGNGAEITLLGGAKASVSTKEVSEEGGEEQQVPTEVGDVFFRDEITFVGVGGSYESVQLYAEAEVTAGGSLTLEGKIAEVDSSTMSLPQFGFNVSDTANLERMHVSGQKGSYLYGNKGDTVSRFYSKEYGELTNGSDKVTVSGSMDWTAWLVAGAEIKMIYTAATSGGRNGGYSLYVTFNGETELVAKVEGLSETDAPYGSVFLGISSYRTLKITFDALRLYNNFNATFDLDKGELISVNRAIVVGEEPTITKTNIEIGLNNGAQSFVSNDTAINLKKGGVIEFEGVILSKDITGLNSSSSVGFSISDSKGTSWNYSVGYRNSFFYDLYGKGMAIYRHQANPPVQYTSVPASSRPPQETGMSLGGNLNPSTWLIEGYKLKVTYKAASSQTAKDGSWELSVQKPYSASYSLVAYVYGMDYDSAPYGPVYFAFEVQGYFSVSFANLRFTADGKPVALTGIKNNSSVIVRHTVNGEKAVETKNFEKDLFNGGFEYTADDWAIGFGKYGDYTESVITATDSNVAEGERSLKFDKKAGEESGVYSDYVYLTQGSYVLNFDYQGEGKPKIAVRYYDDYDLIKTDTFTVEASLTGYSAREIGFTAPSGTVKADVLIFGENADVFTDYFDNLKVYENTFEYSLFKMEKCVADNDENAFGAILSEEKLRLVSVDPQLVSEYFVALKAASCSEIHIDELQEIIFRVNSVSGRKTVAVAVKNGDFSETDVISYPLNWKIVGRVGRDSELNVDKMGEDGYVTINSVDNSLSIESRFINVGGTLIAEAIAKGSGTVKLTVTFFDGKFNVTDYKEESFALTSEFETYSVSVSSVNAVYATVKLGGTGVTDVTEVRLFRPDDSDESKVAEAAECFGVKEILGDNADAYSVKTDLVLPEAFGDAEIEWQIDGDGVNASSGKITRPVYGGNPAIVTLKATFKYGDVEKEKIFNVLVLPEEYDDYRRLTVYNGNAEDDQTDDYYSVGGFIRQDAGGVFGISKAIVFDGENSFKIARISSVSNLRSRMVFGITDNRTYIAQCLIYSPFADYDVRLILEFYGYDGLIIKDYVTRADSANTGKWSVLNVSGIAPVGAVSAAIKIQRNDTANTAVYYDSMALYELPSVLNGNFNFAKDWTKAGSVTFTGGKAVLSGAASLESALIAAIPNADYFITVNVSAPVTVKAGVYSSASTRAYEEEFNAVSGKNVFRVYGAYNARYLRISVVSAGGNVELDDVAVDWSGYATQVVGGNFDLPLTRAWQVSVPSAATVTGEDVKTLKLTAANSLESSAIKTEEGKKYVISATVKGSSVGSATVKLVKYSYNDAVMEETTVITNRSTDSEKYFYEFVCPHDCKFVKIKLASTSAAEYQNVSIRGISDSVSDYTFESVNTVNGGTVPVQWEKVGVTDVQSVYNDGYENFDKLLAVKLVGVSEKEGGIESTYINVEGEKSYEATLACRIISGKFTVRISYYDGSFNLINRYDKEISGGTAATVNGVSPADAAYATVSILPANGAEIYADNVTLYKTVREIGNASQLFIDDYMIDGITGGERVFHQARMEEIVMGRFADNPVDIPTEETAYIYGTVFFDEEENVYKMWYRSCSEKYGIYDAYATSADGINWDRPELGIYNVGGNSANNIYDTCYMGTVFKDENEPDPNKRYKMITFSEKYFKHMVMHSADGLRWTAGPVIATSGDVLTAAYDATNDEYFISAKFDRGKRTFYMYRSADAQTFEEGVKMYSLADPIDAIGYMRTDCYGSGYYEVSGTYIAFDWTFNIPGYSIMHGPVEIKLAYSRDLTEDWQRPTREAIVPKDDGKGHTLMSMYTASYAIDVGDEIWLYVSDMLYPHEVGGNVDSSIQIAKWRKDGFASLDFAEEGVLTTKKFIVEGDKLIVNANAAGGSIRAELVDENGVAIEGFTKADSSVITTDSVSGEITFGKDLSSLQGRTVSLRLYCENCEVYSFTLSK